MTALRRVRGVRSFYWREKGCGDRSGASPAAGRWERLYVTGVELSTIDSLASVAVAEERLHSFPLSVIPARASRLSNVPGPSEVSDAGLGESVKALPEMGRKSHLLSPTNFFLGPHSRPSQEHSPLDSLHDLAEPGKICF